MNGSFICNCQKLEAFFHLLFNREWINKLWYDPYNELLLGSKKELTIGIYCNMDDSQDNDAEYEE